MQRTRKGLWFFVGILVGVSWFFPGSFLQGGEVPVLPGPDGTPGGSYWRSILYSNGRADTWSDTVSGPEGKEEPALYLRLLNAGGIVGWGLEPPMRVTPGSKLRFSVWIRGETLTPLSIRLEGVSGNSRRMLDRLNGPTGAFSWRRFEKALEIPADVTEIRVAFMLENTPGTVWIARPQLESATDVEAEGAKSEIGEESLAENWMEAQQEASGQIAFSRELELVSEPVSAWAQVVSQNPGRLLVNGREMIPGLNAGEAVAFDITSALKKGENLLALEVASSRASVMIAGGGILADQSRFEIASGNGWVAKALPSEAILPIQSRAGGPIGRLQSVAEPLVVGAEPVSHAWQVQAGELASMELKLDPAVSGEDMAKFLPNLEWKFFQNGVEIILSARSPSVSHQEGRLHVELPISRFARGGSYTWRLEAPGLVIAVPGAPEFQVEPARLQAGARRPFYKPGASNRIETGAGEQSAFSYAPRHS